MNTSLHQNSLNYVARGEGPPVILVHGMAASLHDWEALMPCLASAGFRALAMDLFGHGESDKPDDIELYTLDTIYTTLVGWLEDLKETPPYFMVGHSLGGYLSMRYALDHPDKVRGLALIDPLFSRNQLPTLLRWLNLTPAWGARSGVKALQYIPLWIIDAVLGWDPIPSAQFSPEARWQIAVDYKRASPYVLRITRTIPDLTQELSRINAPALVLWGERDLTLMPDSFPELVEALPNSRGKSIPNCGHQPHIGEPELVNLEIMDFLQGRR